MQNRNKIINKIFIGILFLAFNIPCFSQVGLNTDGATADASSILDVKSTNQGILIPRMSETERTSIGSPATGLIVYQTDNTKGFYYWDSSTWVYMFDIDGVKVIKTTDVKVDGSSSIGNGSISGQNFGFTTLFIKDETPRIEFLDTSVGTFPTNDWTLMANDFHEGGKEAFMILDGAPGPIDTIVTIETGAGNNAFYIDDLGNVGLGINAPTEKLHVNGNMHADGDITATGTITQVSDKRLKKNIQSLDNGIELVQLLQPKQYEFRTEEFSQLNLPQGNQYGLIAQEVETVLPELVTNEIATTDKSGNTIQLKTVNYLGLVPVMIQAMQERQAIIEFQQKEIETSKPTINEMAEIEKQYQSVMTALYSEDGSLNKALAAKILAVSNTQ